MCSVTAIEPLSWTSDQVLLFRDFWLAITITGLSAQGTWPQNWIESLLKIAKSSPPLVVEETLTPFETDLSSKSILRKKLSDDVRFGEPREFGLFTLCLICFVSLPLLSLSHDYGRHSKAAYRTLRRL